jgi:hypothetical protein
LLDFIFDMAFRKGRDLAEYRAGEYRFLLTPESSDYLFYCLKHRLIPARVMPVLVHEYTHAFLSKAPLVNLYAVADQAYAFTRSQHVFSHENPDYRQTFQQSYISDRLLRYISFWQEGLATFVELSSRCDEWADNAWSDSIVSFKMAIAHTIGRGQWSYADYEACIIEQSARMAHVLKGPVPVEMESSYLAAFLIIKGIHEFVVAKIPQMDIDSFAELMRCILFSDRTIWCEVAEVMGQASRDQIAGAQITRRLRSCFSTGCKRVALFLSDISMLSDEDGIALLSAVRDRTFASNEMVGSDVEPNGGYARMSLPMLKSWSNEPDQIPAETLADLAARTRPFDHVATLRARTADFIYHDQRFSPFEVFGHEVQDGFIIIDSRGVVAYRKGFSIALYVDILEYVNGKSPLDEIAISDLLYHKEFASLSDGRIYLFMLRAGESEMGIALISEDFAYVTGLTKQLRSADYLRTYRALLIDFIRSRSLRGNGLDDANSPVTRFQKFENLRREHLKQYDDHNRDWTGALGQVIEFFPKAQQGPGSLPELMKSESYCPAIDVWFGGPDKAEGKRRCNEFALAQTRGLYLQETAMSQ